MPVTPKIPAHMMVPWNERRTNYEKPVRTLKRKRSRKQMRAGSAVPGVEGTLPSAPTAPGPDPRRSRLPRAHGDVSICGTARWSSANPVGPVMSDPTQSTRVGSRRHRKPSLQGPPVPPQVTPGRVPLCPGTGKVMGRGGFEEHCVRKRYRSMLPSFFTSEHYHHLKLLGSLSRERKQDR